MSVLSEQRQIQQLEAHIAELERELERKAEIVSTLADRVASLERAARAGV